jgi:hypothetical protein
MFSFGKKKEKVDKEEKEKKKRDKKEKKGQTDSGRLTHEDLSRLDEIRNSLRIGKQVNTCVLNIKKTSKK